MVTVAVDVSTTDGSRFRSASTTNTCAGDADHAPTLLKDVLDTPRGCATRTSLSSRERRLSSRADIVLLVNVSTADVSRSASTTNTCVG